MISNDRITISKSTVKSGLSAHAAVSSFPNDAAHNRSSHSALPLINHSLSLYILSDIIALLLGIAGAWISLLIINNTLVGSDSTLLNIFNVKQTSSFLLISAGVLFGFAYNGHYRMRMPFWMEANSVAKSLGLALLVDGFLQFALKQDISRLLTISSWVFAAFAIIALRSVVRKFISKLGVFQIPTLLIGSGETAQQTQAAVESAPEMGYVITAQIKNLPEAFLQAGRSWKNLCEQFGVQHLIIAVDGKDLQGTESIMAKLMRESISYSVVPPLQNLPVTGMTSQYFINHNTMLLTHNGASEQRLPQMIKRMADVAVSGIALLLLSPIMLIIALLVRMDGGSAFFGHKRIGRGAKIFPCFKFRSMIMGGDAILKKHLAENPQAAEEWKATQKLQNDPRVTSLGKFLRKTSLDELPQLINVLKGDMSLVGPRPIVNDELEHYNHDIAYYYRVRPGVTGLWQVSGRNDVSYAQRVKMDSWYVRNWSLWHDIVILFKTIPAVFKRSGAY